MGGLCSDIALGLLNLSWHGEVLDGLLTDRSPARGPWNGDHLRWVSDIHTRLRVGFGFDEPLKWKGQPLQAFSLILNTACQVGSDAVKLAARLHGQCELHAWVDGPNRAWLADIIQAGLHSGVFRKGIWYQDVPNGPKDKWSDQGWGDVIALLRERDDEPVVTSYSVTDRFPNRSLTTWNPPPMPENWKPQFWEAEDWAAQSGEERAEYYDEHAQDLWYELPVEEQWRLAMDGLRADTASGLEMKPDNWQTFRFRHELTFLDLHAVDRDERLDRALGIEAVTVDD
jgi:hypothetical protein